MQQLQSANTSMQHHLLHHSHRALAMGLAAASMVAMGYVGLYQSRAVRHIWCPVFAKGCEAVPMLLSRNLLVFPMDTSRQPSTQ